MSRDTQTLAEMTAELALLATSGKKHQERLHSTKKARLDTGEMTFCPGCRMIMLSHWIDAEIQDMNKGTAR